MQVVMCTFAVLLIDFSEVRKGENDVGDDVLTTSVLFAGLCNAIKHIAVSALITHRRI